MKALNLFLLAIMLFATTAAAADFIPSEKVEVIDNNGYSWGYIPPIENVGYMMNHLKWNPILSSDGKWMVFLGRRNRKLWLVPSEGGTPVEIFDLETKPLPEGSRGQTIDETTLKFTPDGNELSFTIVFENEDMGSYDVYSDADSTFSSPRNRLYSIMTFNPSTNEYREVVKNGIHYDWSADGRYICYINIDPRAYYDPANAEHHCAPAIYDTQTGKTRFLTDENWNQNILNQTKICSPYIGTTFSPDGSHIVASKYINESRQLVKIPFEGGEPEQITFVDQKAVCSYPFCVLPKYSPNGDWILFNIERTMVIMSTKSGEIYDFYSRKPFKLTGAPIETPIFQIMDAYNYSWSFDGNKITYNLWAIWDTLQNNLALGSQYGVFNHYIVIYDFKPETFEKITSVEETQPEEFSITGNYPNPFNPATTIDFTLPEAGYADLAVYNVAGQKICELVSGILPAGRHSVVWDGRDQNGKSVSSGVYITRLMMRDKVTTRSMMLLK
ncbi:T9SS type A sorting domain-containing protein [bacterium]|nr:T9SS type A sorting domain-containing protein [bacterium]